MEVIHTSKRPMVGYLVAAVGLGPILLLAVAAGFPRGSLVLGVMAAISVALGQQTIP